VKEEPETYLGADIWIHELAGHKARALSSDTYVQHAVEEVKRELVQVGKQLKKKAVSYLEFGYRPELDALLEFDKKQASCYASLMAVLWWCIKLGWINIVVEVYLLAWFQAS
jgi:hypothetical protein